MTGMPPRPTTVWALYAWPGGRWLVAPWSCVPGAKDEHGTLQWAPSLEAARELVPDGLEREDPKPSDLEANPALVETWK